MIRLYVNVLLILFQAAKYSDNKKAPKKEALLVEYLIVLVS